MKHPLGVWSLQVGIHDTCMPMMMITWILHTGKKLQNLSVKSAGLHDQSQPADFSQILQFSCDYFMMHRNTQHITCRHCSIAFDYWVHNTGTSEWNQPPWWNQGRSITPLLNQLKVYSIVLHCIACTPPRYNLLLLLEQCLNLIDLYIWLEPKGYKS